MSAAEFSAWNPGIESEIPKAWRELETIYNPANVFTRLEQINQLSIETGLSPEELIALRPHRLVSLTGILLFSDQLIKHQDDREGLSWCDR